MIELIMFKSSITADTAFRKDLTLQGCTNSNVRTTSPASTKTRSHHSGLLTSPIPNYDLQVWASYRRLEWFCIVVRPNYDTAQELRQWLR